MEKIVPIKLFGQTFNFQADSDPEKARDVADWIMDEVAKVESQHQAQPQQVNKLAIMISAALNIASDSIEMKRNESKVLKEISGRSSRLSRRLDRWLELTGSRDK
jgi:cell division protein ZapA (FtsZ GTPase activity inhibitor)